MDDTRKNHLFSYFAELSTFFWIPHYIIDFLSGHFYFEIFWLLWVSACGSSPQEWGQINGGSWTKQMHRAEAEQPSKRTYLSVLGPSPVVPAARLTLDLQNPKPVDTSCMFTPWLLYHCCSSPFKQLAVAPPSSVETNHQWDTPVLPYARQGGLFSLLQLPQEVFYFHVCSRVMAVERQVLSTVLVRRHTPRCSTSLFSYSTINRNPVV